MGPLNFKRVNNLTEYKQLLQSLRDKFSCEEEWEEYFGFSLKWNEDTGEVLETLMEHQGQLENAPEEDDYPVICTYLFDGSIIYDRLCGDIEIKLFDWEPLKNMKEQRFERTSYYEQ